MGGCVQKGEREAGSNKNRRGTIYEDAQPTWPIRSTSQSLHRWAVKCVNDEKIVLRRR